MDQVHPDEPRPLPALHCCTRCFCTWSPQTATADACPRCLNELPVAGPRRRDGRDFAVWIIPFAVPILTILAILLGALWR